MKLDFYADPGHGWLKVPRTLINKLGIQNDISPYSYQHGEFVYLEEDCDAGLFIQAASRAGIEFQFNDHVSNKSSQIRNYMNYRK